MKRPSAPDSSAGDYGLWAQELASRSSEACGHALRRGAQCPHSRSSSGGASPGLSVRHLAASSSSVDTCASAHDAERPSTVTIEISPSRIWMVRSGSRARGSREGDVKPEQGHSYGVLGAPPGLLVRLRRGPALVSSRTFATKRRTSSGSAVRILPGALEAHPRIHLSSASASRRCRSYSIRSHMACSTHSCLKLRPAQ